VAWKAYVRVWNPLLTLCSLCIILYKDQGEVKMVQHSETILLQLSGDTTRGVKIVLSDEEIVSDNKVIDLERAKIALVKQSVLFSIQSVEQLARKIVEKHPALLTQLLQTFLIERFGVQEDDEES